MSPHMAGPTSPQPRREFLTRAALLTAAVALGCSDDPTRALAPNADPSLRRNDDLPTGEDSGIEHVVLLMMENRSFDHLLGWAPRADGRQAGLVYRDQAGVRHHTHSLAPDFQGCGHSDPDHSYEGGRVQYNGGRCDGFLRSGDNDLYSIGYYVRNDLPFFQGAVPDWTIGDRFFCSMMGPTFPNRIFQLAAQTDRIVNSSTPSTLPTIIDRLLERGLTALNYFSDLPTTALWGTKYQPLWRPITAFFADCQAGTLPHFSWIDPRYGGAEEGLSNDDHPFADVRAGQDFMNQIYRAVTTSSAWAKTVFIIDYDEWGGFFDHVPPPHRSVSPIDTAAGYTDGLLGFRTPLFVISPFARRGHVSHVTYDHSAILKMIEWRWDLEPLTERDRTANNLAADLRFKNPQLHAPQYQVPSVVATPCPGVASPLVAEARPHTRAAWRALARERGF